MHVNALGRARCEIDGRREKLCVCVFVCLCVRAARWESNGRQENHFLELSEAAPVRGLVVAFPRACFRVFAAECVFGAPNGHRAQVSSDPDARHCEVLRGELVRLNIEHDAAKRVIFRVLGLRRHMLQRGFRVWGLGFGCTPKAKYAQACTAESSPTRHAADCTPSMCANLVDERGRSALALQRAVSEVLGHALSFAYSLVPSTEQLLGCS